MSASPLLGVLHAALPAIWPSLPDRPRVRVWRALPGLRSLLPNVGQVQFLQGFKPWHDALLGECWGEVGDGLSPPGGEAPDLGLVLLPRDRDEARAAIVEALREVRAGGIVLGAAMNDEGARGFEKDFQRLRPLAGQLSKAHGRAFWMRAAELDGAAAVLAGQWLAADAERATEDGHWRRAGVFNGGALDVGSALLLVHLPATLKGAIADLGTGSGLLAEALIQRCPGVTAVDLFEAEARALALARRHLLGSRVPVGFHWHDVALGVPGPYSAIVCNPPFHVGSRGVPALGQAFIATARRALSRDGQLFLVANRHLPYEDTLREHFAHGEVLTDERGFKVFRAWSPKGDT